MQQNHGKPETKANPEVGQIHHSQSGIIYYGLSDIGLSRANNEDVWAAMPDYGFFGLADGMGGHQAGEVAAKTVIDSLCDSVQLIKTTNCMELIIELRHAIEQANRQIFQMAKKNKALSGMGTTLCCFLWTQTMVIHAHVGDSRLYRLRNQSLELLTEDHSFLAKWKACGRLAETCETPYPYKNVITRAVGTSELAKPEISLTTHEVGDLYLLCTDGLSDALTSSEMEALLNASPNLSIACHKLIETAKIKGSSDNITLLIIESVGLHAKNLLGQ